MNKLTSKYFIPKMVLAICVLSGMVVFAAQTEIVNRTLNIARPTVEVVIAGSVQRQDKTIALEKIESVGTGEVLTWTINSVNSGEADAQNYKVVGQIPRGTVLEAGSAQGEGDPTVKFSIDGGKTFSAVPTVEEKQADGNIKNVPAPADSYTQLRFEWAKPLAANSKLTATYRVRVK